MNFEQLKEVIVAALPNCSRRRHPRKPSLCPMYAQTAWTRSN